MIHIRVILNPVLLEVSSLSIEDIPTLGNQVYFHTDNQTNVNRRHCHRYFNKLITLAIR